MQPTSPYRARTAEVSEVRALAEAGSRLHTARPAAEKAEAGGAAAEQHAEAHLGKSPHGSSMAQGENAITGAAFCAYVASGTRYLKLRRRVGGKRVTTTTVTPASYGPGLPQLARPSRRVCTTAPAHTPPERIRRHQEEGSYSSCSHRKPSPSCLNKYPNIPHMTSSNPN